MKPLERIKLLKEHAQLVQAIPTLKALDKIRSLKRLAEIVALLGSVADDKNRTITEWNSDQHSDLLDKVLANTTDLTTAYSQYFSDNLQGKSVITKIGKVWINGETKKEVRKDLDKIKLLTVPYIPEILIKGDIGEPVPNKDLGNPKKPKKQKYESFIPFTHTIHIKNIAIETTIQVGKLFNGGQLSYSLNAKEMQFDGLFVGNKKPNSGNAPIEKSWYQTSQVGYDNIIPQSDDGVNIEIIRISDEMGRELAAGEALSLLLDNAKTTNKTPLNLDNIEPLHIDDNTKAKKAVERYLSQFKGKYITTVDGKNVVFNSKGRNHLANDVVFGENLVVKAIGKVVEVLTQGKFIEVQDLNKDRYDSFIAFHVYRKWVEIDGCELHLQIKVAQLQDGSFETGNGLIAYSAKNAENQKVATPPVSPSNDDLPINSGDYHLAEYDNLFDKVSQETVGSGLVAYSASNAELKKDEKAITPPATQYDSVPMNSGAYRLFNENHTAFDKVSQETSADYVFLEILEVRPLNNQKNPTSTSGGNETVQPLAGNENSLSNTLNNVKPFNRSQITIPKSKNARQSANNQAIAILDKLDNGEMSVADLSDDDKAALAKYSGNGGGLIGRDGKLMSAGGQFGHVGLEIDGVVFGMSTNGWDTRDKRSFLQGYTKASRDIYGFELSLSHEQKLSVVNALLTDLNTSKGYDFIGHNCATAITNVFDKSGISVIDNNFMNYTLKSPMHMKMFLEKNVPKDDWTLYKGVKTK